MGRLVHKLPLGKTPAEKKWRLFRAWAAGHPVWCAWQVTYRCNFRCRFCHYWSEPLGAKPEPTPGQYADAAGKLAKLGTLMISLAGGEPLLRHDMPEVVEAIGRYHFPFLTTNGWFVTPELARSLMRAGLWGASVSIDYADGARHDARRGAPGAWAQAWRAVEWLAAARLHNWQRVNVLAVLMEDNLDDIEPLVRMAARHGAYFMIQCYGFRKTGARRFEHQDGPVSPRLLELHRRYPNFLSNPYYLGRFDRHLRGGVEGCRAGRSFFNIDSTGDIAVCVESKHEPVANLHRDSVSSILPRRGRRRTEILVATAGTTAEARWNACTARWRCSAACPRCSSTAGARRHSTGVPAVSTTGETPVLRKRPATEAGEFPLLGPSKPGEGLV